jgi:hypothetical protein
MDVVVRVNIVLLALLLILHRYGPVDVAFSQTLRKVQAESTPHAGCDPSLRCC